MAKTYFQKDTKPEGWKIAPGAVGINPYNYNGTQMFQGYSQYVDSSGQLYNTMVDNQGRTVPASEAGWAINSDLTQYVPIGGTPAPTVDGVPGRATTQQLGGMMNQGNGWVPWNGGTFNPPSISSANQAPQTPLPYQSPTPTPVPNINNLGNEYSFENYYKAHPDAKPGYTSPDTVLSAPESELSKTIKDIRAQQLEAAGRPAYQSQQEDIQGIQAKQQLVNDLSNQLNLIKVEGQAIPLQAAGVNQTAGMLGAQQAEQNRQNAVKALTVYAQLQGAQGNLQTAQAAADRATNLKYAPLEAEIKAKIANADLMLKDPEYTVSEKQRAQQVKDIQDAKQAKIDQAKQDAKDIWSDVYIKAVENGLTDPTAIKKIMDLRETTLTNPNAKYEAVQLAGSFLQDITYQTQTLNGRSVRFGFRGAKEVSRQDLGAAGVKETTLTSEDRRTLLGGGLVESEITQIENDVRTYGIDKTLEGISDSKQKAAISKVYGGSETKLTRANVSSLFGIPDNNEKSGGFLGFGKKVNKDELDKIMASIKKYQDVGYSDTDILKLMGKQ